MGSGGLLVCATSKAGGRARRRVATDRREIVISCTVIQSWPVWGGLRGSSKKEICRPVGPPGRPREPRSARLGSDVLRHGIRPAGPTLPVRWAQSYECRAALLGWPSAGQQWDRCQLSDRISRLGPRAPCGIVQLNLQVPLNAPSGPFLLTPYINPGYGSSIYVK